MQARSIFDRRLSTGDRVLFDKDARELIVIGAAEAGQQHTWDSALALIPSGKAHHFDKASLQSVFEAMQHVVFLSP